MQSPAAVGQTVTVGWASSYDVVLWSQESYWHIAVVTVMFLCMFFID